jgi:hypothetical protein
MVCEWFVDQIRKLASDKDDEQDRAGRERPIADGEVGDNRNRGDKAVADRKGYRDC